MASERITTGALLREAFRTIFDNIPLALKLIAPAMGVALLAGLMRWQIFGAATADESASIFSELFHFVLGLALGAIELLVFVPAATAWHRFTTFGSIDRGDGRAIGWDAREWRFCLYWVIVFWIGVSLILVVIVFLVEWVSSDILLYMYDIRGAVGAGSEIAVGIVMNLAILVLSVLIPAFIIAKFGAVLPASAIGAGIGGAGHRAAWRRLHSAVFKSVCVIILLSKVSQFVLFGIVEYILPHARVDLVASALRSLLGQGIDLVAYLLIAVVLSRVYVAASMDAREAAAG